MIEVILDTETTGLSAEKDRIVEIACVELSNHIPTKNIFHTFLNPETKVSADAFSVHGYSDEFLSKKFMGNIIIFLNRSDLRLSTTFNEVDFIK